LLFRPPRLDLQSSGATIIIFHASEIDELIFAV
jgi:hypothetical protein